MEKLSFDSGIKEYDLGTGVPLRFNPSDPNVYARFLDAVENIKAVEAAFVEQAGKLTADMTPEERGSAVVHLMADMDAKMKAELDKVFVGNCFADILRGVNVLAVGSNGERVITNLMAVLAPIMQAGAEACADTQVDEARLNREQRRAAQRAQH